MRSAARSLVAREVIAGRATVPEAAALIGWIDALPPQRPAIQTGQVAAMAGLPDSGGYTAAELLGVRVVMHVGVAERNDAVGPPGSVGRARAAFLAARRGGVHPTPGGRPQTDASGCWNWPGPRRKDARPFGRARPIQAAE